MNTLNKIKPIYLFIILYAVFALFCFGNVSVWAFDLFKYQYIENFLFKIICYICIIFNIFVYKVYSVKKFIIHLLLTCGVLTVCHNIDNYHLCWLWFYLLAIPPVNFNKISKIALAVTTVMMSAIVILVGLGYGDNVMMLRPATMIQRYYYGFVNPNIFAASLLQICMALIYIRWKNIKSIDNLFMFSVLCLTFFFTNSRTTALLIILLIAAANIAQNMSNNNALKLTNISAEASLIFCPAISFIITQMYRNSSNFALWLDELVSYRFRNLCYCMATLPINFFGTEINIDKDLMVLHNLYGTLLMQYGIFTLGMFLAGFAFIIRKAYLKKDIPFLIIMIICLIQGISENYLITPYINYAFLAFSGLLNNTELFEKS